jgi:hypothetical protein
MLAIVPLIFILFLLPGIVYGYAAKTISGHRDIIQGMSKSMSTMGYYIVLAFFASLFIAAFAQSNIGALLAIKGANFLRDLGLPGQVTIVGIILLSGLVNLLIGSASAKWALLAPIFVPMLMQLEFPRTFANRLPHRRFVHEYHHAADAVFPARRGFRSKICQKHRNRHDCILDAAVFNRVFNNVDYFLDDLLDARHSARIAGALYLSINRDAR